MNKHAGSTFDSFLEEEGIKEECEETAKKRVAEFLESQKVSKPEDKPKA